MCGRNTRAAEDPSAATTLAMAGGGVLAATPAMAVMAVMAIDEKTMAVFTGMIVTTGSAGTSAATSAETSAAANAATTEVTEDRNEGMTATGATTAAATTNDATTAAAMAAMAAMAGDLIHIGTIEEMSGTDITMMLGSARLESLERLETEMVEMLEMVEMHGSERDGRATTRTATQKHHGGHAREVTTGAAMDATSAATNVATSAATNVTTIGETIGATNATLPVTRREEETTGLQVATPWPLAAATRGIRLRRVVLRTDGARQPGRKPVRRWRKLRPRPVRRRSCVSRSRTRP